MHMLTFHEGGTRKCVRVDRIDAISDEGVGTNLLIGGEWLFCPLDFASVQQRMLGNFVPVVQSSKPSTPKET